MYVISLQILDLSHCELEEASALEYLPTVTMLDISHNRLRLLPRLSPTATYSLTILIANNNLISHISGKFGWLWEDINELGFCMCFFICFSSSVLGGGDGSESIIF